MQLACQATNCKVTDIGIGLEFEKNTIDDVQSILKDALNQGLENLNIPGNVSKKAFEKYDKHLPEQLLDKAYERNHLCLSGAARLILEINSSYE